MKVAMISSWHVHARGYAEELMEIPNVEITAVWDEDQETGTKWAEELHCKFIADYDALLADPSIDGIVMTAPTNRHGELLLKAAKAGKHIFTEKVLALTSAECAEIQKVIEEKQLHFTISYPHQCRADIQFAKEMVEQGALGEITYARIRNAHDGSSAGWLPPHFYDEEQCGGGAMMDLGAHPMYLLNWLLGEPESVVSCFTKVTGKPVEDNAVSVMEFQNGAIGVSETGFVSANNPLTLEISGTKGSLMVRNDVSYANAETDNKWVTTDKLPEAWPKPLEQWVGSVTGECENHLGIKAAVSLTKMMEGAYAAWKSGTKYQF